MEELLTFLVTSLVSSPQEVHITRAENERGDVRLSIAVDPEERGMIIGKHGKTIQAIRTLVRLQQRHSPTRIQVDLEEDAVPHNENPDPLDSPYR